MRPAGPLAVFGGAAGKSSGRGRGLAIRFDLHAAERSWNSDRLGRCPKPRYTVLETARPSNLPAEEALRAICP